MYREFTRLPYKFCVVPSFWSHLEKLETDKKPSWRGKSHVDNLLIHRCWGAIQMWGCRKEYEKGYAFSSLPAQISRARRFILVMFFALF